MTLKFTKTGVGAESGNESLLFEFLDHEIPANLELEWETALATSKFAGDTQTNQIIGTYLNPITFSGKLFGDYLDEAKKRIIRANERYEQLKRLEKRIIKFWFEGIKQLVVIDELKKGYSSINEIEYTITIQPHDIQLPIEPSLTKKMLDESKFALTTATSTKELPKDLNGQVLPEVRITRDDVSSKNTKDNTQLTQKDKKKAIKQVDNEIKKANEDYKKRSLLDKLEDAKNGKRYDYKSGTLVEDRFFSQKLDNNNKKADSIIDSLKKKNGFK